MKNRGECCFYLPRRVSDLATGLSYVNGNDFTHLNDLDDLNEESGRQNTHTAGDNTCKEELTQQRICVCEFDVYGVEVCVCVCGRARVVRPQPDLCVCVGAQRAICWEIWWCCPWNQRIAHTAKMHVHVSNVNTRGLSQHNRRSTKQVGILSAIYPYLLSA